MKNIYEQLLLRVSCRKFATAETFMNKNNYIFSNVKKNIRFVVLEMKVSFWVSICKLLKYSCFRFAVARLNFSQLLCITPIFKTLVLHSVFPFGSICQLFCHSFFYIAVCHSVTLHAASKQNHRHNKQKWYDLVISKYTWSNSYWIIYCYCYRISYWNSYC